MNKNKTPAIENIPCHKLTKRQQARTPYKFYSVASAELIMNLAKQAEENPDAEFIFLHRVADEPFITKRGLYLTDYMDGMKLEHFRHDDTPLIMNIDGDGNIHLKSIGG